MNLEDLRAWAYAVDRKIGRQDTRKFLQLHTGVRFLRELDISKYETLIVACQQELGTTERPPSVNVHGKIFL